MTAKKAPKMLRATHESSIMIGEKELPCAVLEDGTTILSQTSMFAAFGRARRGPQKGGSRVPNMPSFADATNLKPFIDKELPGGIKLIPYLSKTGQEMKGYRAEVLPGLCEAYLKAKEAGVLRRAQLKFAAVAHSMIRVFAKVGIVAWIHEVTGYQYVRSANALSALVALYIEEEKRKWQKEFRDEFYVYALRLYGRQAKGNSRPGFLAQFTNKYIYSPMERGEVLKELDRLNPLVGKSRRTRLHQHLSAEYGIRRLHERIEGTIICLKLAGNNKRKFASLYSQAFPDGTGTQGDLFDDSEEGEVAA